MERVKPIYLSRTYDISLPKDSSRFDPDEFMDKMARMKGRLLKGGEPDLESVAKIILSDWVRGRIPYFVPPPERPQELNEAEAKKAKREGKNGKETAGSDTPEVPGVKQNLGSIMQKNTFVSEDIQPLDPEFRLGGDETRESDDSGSEWGGIQDESNQDDTQEELTWNDVYAGDSVPHDDGQSIDGELDCFVVMWHTC
jgi:nuclear GTP-binding protein